MLTVDLADFAFELDEGAIKHVGASNRSATVKLYDVDAAEAREYGDKRVKLAIRDGDENEIEVSLFPEEARALRDELDRLVEESRVFE